MPRDLLEEAGLAPAAAPRDLFAEAGIAPPAPAAAPAPRDLFAEAGIVPQATPSTFGASSANPSFTGYGAPPASNEPDVVMKDDTGVAPASFVPTPDPGPQANWYNELRNFPQRAGAQLLSTAAGIRDYYHNNPMFNQGSMGIALPVQNPGPTAGAEALREKSAGMVEGLPEPTTTGGKAVKMIGGAVTAIAPAVLSGPAAPFVADAQVSGDAYNRAYEGNKQKLGPAAAAQLAVGTANVAGPVSGLAGGVPGVGQAGASVAKRIVGGVVYGGTQAGATEAAVSATTGKRMEWETIPTEAGVGGALNAALPALVSIFTRGKGRISPGVAQAIERDARLAKTPQEVQNIVKQAESLVDGSDAPPGNQPPPPQQPNAAVGDAAVPAQAEAGQAPAAAPRDLLAEAGIAPPAAHEPNAPAEPKTQVPPDGEAKNAVDASVIVHTDGTPEASPVQPAEPVQQPVQPVARADDGAQQQPGDGLLDDGQVPAAQEVSEPNRNPLAPAKETVVEAPPVQSAQEAGPTTPPAVPAPKGPVATNHIPPLAPHEGSWVVTRKSDGQVIGEFFERKNVERFDPDKVSVETVTQYLGRLNEQIRQNGTDQPRTYTAEEVEEAFHRPKAPRDPNADPRLHVNRETGTPSLHNENFKILREESGVGGDKFVSDFTPVELRKWLDTADRLGMGDVARTSARSTLHNVPAKKQAAFSSIVEFGQNKEPAGSLKSAAPAKSGSIPSSPPVPDGPTPPAPADLASIPEVTKPVVSAETPVGDTQRPVVDTGIPSRAELEAMNPKQVAEITKANGIPLGPKATNIDGLMTVKASRERKGAEPPTAAEPVADTPAAPTMNEVRAEAKNVLAEAATAGETISKVESEKRAYQRLRNRMRPRGSTQLFGETPVPNRPKFEDRDVEKRFREAEGVSPDSMLAKLAEGARSIKNEFTRHFAHLDTSKPADAEAANTLRLREAAIANAPTRAKRDMEGWLRPLDRGEYLRFGRMLALPDILKDVDAGLYEGKSLPFGFRDKAHVEHEMSRLEAGASDKVKTAIAERNAATRDLTKRMVDLNLLNEDVLKDDRYFHRQVMEYMNARDSLATGGKGPDAKLRQKGFQKGRTGGGDFNTDYAQAEHEYLTHAYRQIATAETLARIKSKFDLTPKLREEHGQNWRDHIPADHVLWSPKPGDQFAVMPTVSDAVADSLARGAFDELGDKVNVREALAKVMGDRYVLPENIAAQLDEQPRITESRLAKMSESAMASWKQWVLLNPLRVVKYNLNNMSGDADVALAADPRIIGGMKRALTDLAAFGRGTKNAEIERAMELGVIGSGESLNEIPDISDTGIFRQLSGGQGNPIKWYWDKVRGGSTLRENVTRLAAYRRALELVQQGKDVLWASKPSELRAITDPQERAAKLSRDLLGDYGNISVAGQTIRSRYIPFWSWMEINAPRYARLFTNAAREGRTGRTIGAAAAKGAIGFGKMFVKASALYGLVHLFNRAMFPGEDDGFEDGRLRLIVGRRANGDTLGIRFQGAFSDVLDWGNIQNLPGNIGKVSRGEKDLGEVATESAKAPFKKLITAALPIQKTLAEAATGKRLFPDPFNPRPIRDRLEHVAGAVSLDSLYREAAGIPGSTSPDGGVVLQSTNPGENAYNATRAAAARWLEKQGVERGGGEPTERSNALYYYKRAKAGGDSKKAEKWLAEYKKLGGTDKGMAQSVKVARPLGGVPIERRDEFLSSLSSEQRSKIEKAEAWYRDTYGVDESRMKFEDELSLLRKKRDAYNDAKNARDFKKAGLLHKENRAFGRLRLLEKADEQIRKWEKQVDSGRLPAQKAERRTRLLIQARTKKAA